MNVMDTVKRALGAESRTSKKMRAVWKGTVLAESDQTIVVEGNHYFPAASVDRQYLRPSSSHTVCSWKGVASYYDVVVSDQVNGDAAWYYSDPKAAASQIKDYIAFWHGIRVEAAPAQALT